MYALVNLATQGIDVLASWALVPNMCDCSGDTRGWKNVCACTKLIALDKELFLHRLVTEPLSVKNNATI